MTLLWPWLLGLLILPVGMGAMYVWWLCRKRRNAVSFASLSLVREALGKQSRWRRHVPFVLLVLSVVALVLATTRPQATVQTPLSRTSIILTIDVSRSMCATDVDPNRLTVAQQAARSFIEEHSDGTQIGIVAFAGFAELVVPPTRNKEVLIDAINSLSTSFGTVTGNATLRSVDAIAEINPGVEPITRDDFALDLVRPEREGHVSDIVVLLTDGASVGGVDPLVAAEIAADRRVRVYTIGFGTDEVTAMICTPEQAGLQYFGGPGTFDENALPFGGGGFGAPPRRFLVIDEPTLRAIADTTGGEYFRAENADQLLGVFNDLPTRIVLQDELTEISVFFVMAAAILAITAIGLSLAWNRS